MSDKPFWPNKLVGVSSLFVTDCSHDNKIIYDNNKNDNNNNNNNNNNKIRLITSFNEVKHITSRD